MERSYKYLSRYAAAFAVLAIVGIVLRTLALYTVYDSEIGYYRSGALLPMLFNAMIIPTIIGVISMLFFLPRSAEKKLALSAGTLSLRIAAAFALVTSAVPAFYVFLGMMGDTVLYSVPTVGTGAVIDAFTMIFGVLSVIYFALVIAKKTDRGEGHVYFGYAVILFILMILAKTYFDFNTTMNSPNKLLLQITLMSVMLYFLLELRFSLGNAAPRAYSAVSLVSFCLTAVCSVPGIIAYFAGIFIKEEYLVYHIAVLGFGIYIAVRFVSFCIESKKTEKI
ncbi:MAG: hypothetical protein E7671_01315 [Ruminococcaceae bacterium]|nr:hypothetical protein [Oscillospiraceae bacterium]